MAAIGRSAPAVAAYTKWTVDEHQLGRRPSPQHLNYISTFHDIGIDVPVLYSHILIGSVI
jgi:hypothetical protein